MHVVNLEKVTFSGLQFPKPFLPPQTLLEFIHRNIPYHHHHHKIWWNSFHFYEACRTCYLPSEGKVSSGMVNLFFGLSAPKSKRGSGSVKHTTKAVEGLHWVGRFPHWAALMYELFLLIRVKNHWRCCLPVATPLFKFGHDGTLQTRGC